MKILEGYADPATTYDLSYLALGAGVQSSALLLICEEPELRELYGAPEIDVAVFADVGGELPYTLEYLDYLKTVSKTRIEIVRAGNLETEYLELMEGGRTRASQIPAYTKDGEARGMMPRTCTYDKKIVPMMRFIRTELGFKPRQRMAGNVKVRCLMGISLDEAIRMKPSVNKWQDNDYPLCDARITREKCLAIMREYGWEEPRRSSCYFCPYRTDKGWLYLQKEEPEIFAEAVEFDKKIRNHPKLRSEVYLHKSCKPRGEVELDNGQMEFSFMGDECSGHCGV